MLTYDKDKLGKKYVCTNNSLIGNDLYEITILNFSDSLEYVKVKYESGTVSWLRCKDVTVVDNISTADTTPLKLIGDWAENKVKEFSDTVNDFIYGNKN